MSKRPIVIFVLLIVFVFGLVLFLALYRPSYTDKPFVILISREPDSLHHFSSKMGVGLLVEKALFRGLVERGNNFRVYPELVREVPTLSNGLVKIRSDGKMEVRWRFKRGLRWSDGHPLGPKDVIFTYNLLKHKDVPILALEKADAKFIESMAVIDDGYTLLVVWKKPYYNYLTAHSILPKHLLYESFKNNPKGFDSLAYYKHPVGNGPYRFKEWVSGSYILLEANEYYPIKPKLKRIAFKVVRDVNSILVNLLSGTGDACTNLSPEQYFFLKNRYSDKIGVYKTEGMGWLHIDINLNNDILSDRKVRRAILHGIDREAISRAISYGTYELSHSWLPRRHYGYTNPKTKYLYNPTRAKELLKEAGWIRKADGFLYKGNKVLSFSLMTDTRDKNRVRMAVFMKEDLRRLGIKVLVRAYPTSIIFTKFLPKRDYDMALYAWFMIPRIDGFSYWHSVQIPNRTNNWRGYNFTGFANHNIDNIYKELSTTVNINKRLELFAIHQRIWINELPAYPIFVLQSFSASRKGLTNWRPTGSAIPVTWNVEHWDINN